MSQREGVTIQIRPDLGPQLPLLLSDPSDLREALINLVFNAVDALAQGGTITFVTRSINVPLPMKAEVAEEAASSRSEG